MGVFEWMGCGGREHNVPRDLLILYRSFNTETWVYEVRENCRFPPDATEASSRGCCLVPVTKEAMKPTARFH